MVAAEAAGQEGKRVVADASRPPPAPSGQTKLHATQSLVARGLSRRGLSVNSHSTISCQVSVGKHFESFQSGSLTPGAAATAIRRFARLGDCLVFGLTEALKNGRVGSPMHGRAAKANYMPI